MKVFLAISVLIVLCTAHHDGPSRQEFHKARRECFRSLHVPEDIREQIGNYEYKDLEIVHHYIRCVVTKLRLWNDKDGFVMEKLLEVVEENHPDEELRKKIERCLDNNQQKSNLNAWAYREHMCFKRAGILEPLRKMYKN